MQAFLFQFGLHIIVLLRPQVPTLSTSSIAFADLDHIVFLPSFHPPYDENCTNAFSELKTGTSSRTAPVPHHIHRLVPMARSHVSSLTHACVLSLCCRCGDSSLLSTRSISCAPSALLLHTDTSLWVTRRRSRPDSHPASGETNCLLCFEIVLTQLANQNGLVGLVDSCAI